MIPQPVKMPVTSNEAPFLSTKRPTATKIGGAAGNKVRPIIIERGQISENFQTINTVTLDSCGPGVVTDRDSPRLDTGYWRESTPGFHRR